MTTQHDFGYRTAPAPKEEFKANHVLSGGVVGTNGAEIDAGAPA
jgi:hypothetical protein